MDSVVLGEAVRDITNSRLTRGKVEVCFLILVVESGEDLPEVFNLSILCLAVDVDGFLLKQLDIVRLVRVGLGENHDIMPVQVTSDVV